MFVDVGFVGFLNVGKFILLFVIIVVKLKIVNYVFIIFVFNLGIVFYCDGCFFVMADILGIIENVYQGKGLGFCFLCYIECNVMLFFMIFCDMENI